MKPFFLKTLFLLISGLFFISCQQDDEINKPEQAKFDQFMSFIYMGDAYSSEYYIKDDSFIFSDPAVQEVYDHLAKLPELCTYVNENSIPEYYDTYADYEKMQKVKFRAIGNRVTTWAKLNIYDLPNYQGWSWGFWLDAQVHKIEIPDLNGSFGGPMNMDNRMSSFMLDTHYQEFTGNPPAQTHGDYTEVTFFDLKGCSGRSVVWKGNPYNNQLYVPTLASYNWPVGSPSSVDNTISSLIFKFSY